MKKIVFIVLCTCFNIIHAQQFEWAFAIGNGIGNAITHDQAGNCIVTGTFSGLVDFNPGLATDTITSTSSENIFVAKYDANGNYLWAFSIGSPNHYEATSQSVSVDTHGNIFITGWLVGGSADFNPGSAINNLNPNGYSCLFIAKYNANGNYMWAFTLGDTATSLAENGTSIAIDKNGNVLVTGGFQDTLDFNPSSGVNNLIAVSPYQNAFVAKYDSSGNYLLAFNVESPSGSNGYAISSDSQENILITGSFGGVADFNPSTAINNVTAKGISDIFVAKYDKTGNYIGAFGIGAPGGWSQAVGLSITVDKKDNALITGYFGGSADFAPGSATNIISGNTQSMFVAKYNSSGNNIWAHCITQANAGYGIITDATGNVFVTGDFSGTANFSFTGAANLTALGNEDIFLAKYDSSGIYSWAFNAGCSSKDNVGNAISCDTLSNVWITGQTTGNVDFDPSSSTNDVSTTYIQNSYIAKYNSTLTTGIQKNSNNDLINVFPNPSKGDVIVNTSDAKQGSLVIYNLFGEKVFESTEKNNYFKIDLQSSGIYQVMFTSDSEISTKKIIVER